MKTKKEGREKPFKWLILNCLMMVPFLLAGQNPAFPGAEGFGAMTTGGRGGSVIQVTNLNNSGAGSLRAAIDASGPRTVVFRVSGTIALTSTLRINNDNITIAGQTAPGDGICLKNYPLTIDANNVILRFIRTRHGDQSGSQDDAMNGRNQENIIIDHCSMSWSVDECGSFYDNKNFTLQYCLLSESLYSSIHEKGNHGYGGIWGGQGATFHHNLLAHHTSRNPRFCGSRYTNRADLELIDHRNNVIYNWGGNSCYGAEGGRYNLVNNYYKYGPATSSTKKYRIINPWDDDGSNSQAAGIMGTFYISNNYVYGYPSVTEDNWTSGVQGISSTVKEAIKLTEQLEVPEITEHPAELAFEHVLARVGAILPQRDELDARIVYETMTGTATYGGVYGAESGIIDSQGTVGGWLAMESDTAPTDTDKDGMPDEWEDNMGLDKNDPADRNGDISGNGYTNLEDYLNGLVEEFDYILRPIKLAVDTVIDYAVTLTWEDISDNETGFVIERKDGETWTELNTTVADQSSYTDNSLTGNGDYHYRLKSVNSTLESFYTDSVSVSLTVDVEDFKWDAIALKVFPNPFSSDAQLVYSIPEESDILLSIHDLAGRQMMVLADEIQALGKYSYTINTSSLKSGIYFVKLSTNYSVSLKKVMITQ